jgi:hypothetical protein
MFTKLEGNIKSVQSSLRNDVNKWQNGTREQVERQVKQIETYKDRLDKFNAELNNSKGKISEGSTVVGNTSSLPPTDKNMEASHSTCGSARHHESESNHSVSCTNVDNASFVYDAMPCNNQVTTGVQCEMTCACHPSRYATLVALLLLPT